MTTPAYRIDGRSGERSAFYALACDPARSVVVEACAGSGKTWMLVSRVLRALLAGAEPQEILAITFTRKAAGEMRARLNEWLARFSAPDCSAAERVQALRERGLSPARAETLAPALAALHERVLRSGRRVEIFTFHAWFAQLLRAAPRELLAELRLQPDMELLEDITDHRRAVLQRFRGRVLADAGLRADHDALMASRGRSQVGKWLDAALDKRIEFELADVAGTLEPSVPDAASMGLEFAGLAHPSELLREATAQALLAGVAQALGQQKGAIPQQRGALLEQSIDVEDSHDALRAAHEAVLTREGKLRKWLDVPGLPDLVALLHRVRQACGQQQAHDEHLRMVRLGRVLLAEFADYKRALGLADMADLERCALALLRDSSLSGWVQERLDARIRHVLIDEFQDTSPLQWHALHAWLSAYTGAGGGASGQRPPSVFIVGDPKQSIYRFRRAEPRVFEAARAFVAEGLQGHVLECDHTRRNAPELLVALNTVFEQLQAGGDFSGFRAHSTELGAVPGAGVWALPRTVRPPKVDKAVDALRPWRDSLTTPRHEPEELLRVQEARAVAGAVSALLHTDRVAPGDIQVLSRKRASLRLVADALAELHLPFAAPEKLALLDAPEARDLLALLDALASPTQNLSLAHALRSPVFGASDDDLVQLAHASADDRPWWRALMALPSASPALERARTLLQGWQQAAAHLPPHDLLDHIVAQGQVRERFAATVPAERRNAALSAVDALLNLALSLDGGRYATLYRFVRALKRRALEVAATPQQGAVQLLTIHGAKGLEAQVVFVMDSDPEPQNPDTATLLIDWPAQAEHPVCCAFVYSESVARCPPSLQRLLQQEMLARRREELNCLYVAMTRAKERLVFSATEPSRPDDDPAWWQRVQAVATGWEPEAIAAFDSPASIAPTVTVLALPRWEPAVPAPAPAQPAGAAPQAGNDSTRLGSAVHRVLEWASQGPQPVPATLATLAEAAALEFGASAAEVLRIAGRIRLSPDCARFFDPQQLAWQGSEVAISDAGDSLRLDRLVALNEDKAGEERRVWWVLDYKLEHRPEALAPYRAQLLRYRQAVQRLQPGEQVRCAFITGEGMVVELT
jgi:ATP-dependent helicase/nuclease subunit A